MKYYEVELNEYIDILPPKGNIIVGEDNEKAYKIVKNYLSDYWKECLNEPLGKIKYTFLTPGGGYDTLWDWDSYFMACAVPDEGLKYAKGSVCNLIECMRDDGKPAKNVMSNGEIDEMSKISHPYPLQAQFAYLVAKRMEDYSWVEPYYENLERMIEWYDKNCMKNGFYVWTCMYGNGIDNNPSVYGRADMSSAGIDLANFFYREFRAMEKLSKIFLIEKRVNYYQKKAEALKKQIQDNYFDEVDKMFYNIDCSIDYDKITTQNVKWVTHLKFKSFASLFPLWGKTATKEQAEYLKDKVMSNDEYLACCGVRSHSKNDMVYNNIPMGNPSNWQGPVWGLSNFLTSYGLAKYGFKEEALEVAYRLVRTFAADIEQNGCLHEMYNGDNGQPVMRPGFLSWNLLALKCVDDIQSGTDCTTLDLI